MFYFRPRWRKAPTFLCCHRCKFICFCFFLYFHECFRRNARISSLHAPLVIILKIAFYDGHHGAVFFRIRRPLSHAASLWHNGLVVLGLIHNSQLLLSPAFRFLFFSLKLFQRARGHEPDLFHVRLERQTWRQLGRAVPCTCAKNQQGERAAAEKTITAAVRHATGKNLLPQRS